MTDTALKVTSHVGRDLLQSAQLFRHEHAVVWEYVANGLQYKEAGIKPIVVVEIDVKAKTIKIRDNGRGMLLSDLSRYFQMHGENLDRKQGRPGRGYFGTGKSAAFGIATILRITTVRNGKRSVVQLTRADVEARPHGDEIPVKVLESETRTSTANGTVVEIEAITLRQIDISSIIRHVERHIAHWPDATVIINHHECQFTEPDIYREHQFRTVGTPFEKTLGDATLILKVAKAPLDDEFRGVAILADGVWHETTLAGCERKPFAEYLFGQFDVAGLGEDQSSIPAFDMSRSMKLNPRNELVADILRFVGTHVDAIRKGLEREDRERRKSEEQRRLKQQASKIADLINEHFTDWRSKLRSTMAKAGAGKDLLTSSAQDKQVEDAAILGDELPGRVVGRGSQPSEDSAGTGDAVRASAVKLDESSEEKIAKHSRGSNKQTAAGGFQVAFESMGEHEKRAKYDRNTRTIYINLDHPRILIELKSAHTQTPTEDPQFLRMAYEIAFTEYAIVLAQELSAVQFFYDPQDALVEVRQTLDDLSKVFASSWRP
jgi:hypothetical protein